MVVYQKVKNASKRVIPKGQKLDEVVLSTMKTISSVVGATLGPGGSPVLIERYEHGLPPTCTKDGVTVFRSLGFEDATAQCVMEAARDASVRTASEAGDGTTTATVLAEAIVRLSSAFTRANPRVSPQRIVRQLESAFTAVVEPTIRKLSTKASWDTEEGRKMLKAVATVSANGDTALAEKVLECFDLVGDDGNVTISEINGPSAYEVERIEGFPIGVGYEESCAKFYAKFINDPANQRTVMDQPVFLVYHGRITEIQSLVFLMEQIGDLWQRGGFRHNVVIVATGFSESVLGQLAVNFAAASTINVFPLLAPQSPIANGQLKFLEDVAAITGARVLDPMNHPLDKATVDDLGFGDGLRAFEAYRFRSTIVGHTNEDEVLLKADEIKVQIANAESELERTLLQERLGKLTGGIARLKVIGASNGELKEKRDRAEDAVCAVRGAIKHGVLPGGGWTLLRLCDELAQLENQIIDEVLIPALEEPVLRLLLNCGFSDEAEVEEVMEPIVANINLGRFNKALMKHIGETDPPEVLYDTSKAVVYDAFEGKHVRAFEGGILDSTPAVLEAIRNSISIASLLGTLGGTVVFGRDAELERREAMETNAFNRTAESDNPANERA